MLTLETLADTPRQKQTIILPDGSLVGLSIEYKPLQLGWFIISLTYKDFSLSGVRITNNPNLLRQYKNRLNFGLACFVRNNAEPTLLDDFTSGRAELYILTKDEIQEYEDYLSEQVST